jgi:hypothetical protein
MVGSLARALGVGPWRIVSALRPAVVSARFPSLFAAFGPWSPGPWSPGITATRTILLWHHPLNREEGLLEPQMVGLAPSLKKLRLRDTNASVALPVKTEWFWGC